MNNKQIMNSEQIKKKLIKAGSLVDHCRICHSIINMPDIDADTLAWVFTYMRLFTIKDLRLNMRHNYQTKDISHIQSELSMSLARVYGNTFSENDRDPRNDNDTDKALDRVFIRNIVNFIPRGGGNGDELRLSILDMMRRHGIREGHRPGIEDAFLEQWHQKLHSSCTSEDITICEAYIVFQETNSHDLFYKTLWERGGISIDFLKNMACPLTHGPRYMPQLIPDLKHLLWILKQIHGGSHNFQYLLEVSKWQFDHDLFSMLEDVKNNFGAWWVPGRIMDCRHRLKHFLPHHCPRDPLMIDVSLDNMYKSSIEQIDLRTLNGDDIVALIFLTLQNIQLSYDHEKVTSCIDLWKRLKDEPDQDKWSREWGLQALAALNYIQAMIQSFMDELYELIQPKAQILGEACDISESYLMNFGEEVIRSQNTFSLSKLIDTLFPILRKIANVGSWKIISRGQGCATGIVKAADSLLSIQGTHQEKPHIMLVNSIDGIEDIPPWVAAILTTSDVDILSHLSIRCRNAKVILSTCYEHGFFEKIKLYEGKTLTLSIDNERVCYKEGIIEGAGVVSHKRKKVGPKSVKKSGSKSGNLMQIKEKLSSFIKTPFSITIPFEAFEKTLQNNSGSRALLDKLTSELSSHHQNYPSPLLRIRELITGLSIPNDIVQSIRDEILQQEYDMVQWSKSVEDAITSNIKKVWASVWNERAYLSRFSRKLTIDKVRMGVLIQNVIPADYSFIIHTRNPVSNNSNEILSEVAVGLGETLTGNSPGTPLCVISTKKEHKHTIMSYPSKNMAYFDSYQEKSYIIRSDSNDEDSSDFAGAGLYDSFFINTPVQRLVHYDKERLFWDRDFQYFLFDSLSKMAKEIENIKQHPQDIEGVYYNNAFYLVQTRDQIE